MDLRFVWDPYLNGSILANELEIYQESVLPTGREGKAEVPAVTIVLGGGLWHARQYEVEAVREFKKAVDGITALTTRRDGSEWKSKAPFKGWEGIGDQVFFLPVEEPVYKWLSPSRQVTILPEEVDQMNEYLHQLAPSQGLTIPWVNQVMTSKRPFAYEASGLHIIEPIANRRADIILNLRCNAKVDNAVGSPYDRTCCSQYTSGNWFQWVLIALTLVVSILAACVKFRGYTTIDLESGTYNVSRVITSIASIGLPLAYCFFADRTQLFNKVQKMYQKSEFLTICGIILAIGLLTIRRSKEPPQRQELLSSSKKESFTSKTTLEKPVASDAFLSPPQILEWKGWTITFLLLAQYYAASHEPWIHILSRLCISSQLFLVGYKHTLYFYTTEDSSIRRVATVLVETNLLAVAMAYQMYTSYLFYFLPGLLSFWFLVVWGVLGFGRELNHNIGFLVGKIGFGAGFVVLLHRGDQPVQLIFDTLRLVFGINWDSRDWRDHIVIDPFIVYIGMLAALLNVGHRHLTAGNSMKANSQPAWIYHAKRFLPWLPTLAILASLLTLPIFFHLTLSSFVESKGYDYTVHAWLSPLPVLSYLVLRNSTQGLRNWHSETMKKVGEGGGEMWVLSLHAWGASDGRGVLSVGVFGDRRVDALVLGGVVLGGGALVERGVEGVTRMIMGEGDGNERDATSLPLVKEKEAGTWTERKKLRWGLVASGVRFALLLAILWVLNLITS